VSAVGEHFWQYGVKCDADKCAAAIYRLGLSEAAAINSALAAARDAKWSLVPDRLYPGRDLCPEHARSLVASITKLDRVLKR
jgi:hypothetical protein